jgi:glycosyltransferase involved in cell wall biosynthesis
MTGVAIIIPLLNGAAGLPRLLRSLAALEPPPAEVLAVDGGSADASVAIAEAVGCLLSGTIPVAGRRLSTAVCRKPPHR